MATFPHYLLEGGQDFKEQVFIKVKKILLLCQVVKKQVVFDDAEFGKSLAALGSRFVMLPVVEAGKGDLLPMHTVKGLPSRAELIN